MWEIVAKGFEKLPKVQKIAQYGHTGPDVQMVCSIFDHFFDEN